MKSRLIQLGILLGSFVACHAMGPQDGQSIIKDASYFVVEGNERSIAGGGIPCSAQWAKFYTASGEALATVTKDRCDFLKLKEQLDPDAPKPQPATYAIKYWPAIQLLGGFTKGKPGYFIVFKDKHGNYINRYRYDEKNQRIHVVSGDTLTTVGSIEALGDLDTSVCVERDSDEITERPEAGHSQQTGCLIQ